MGGQQLRGLERREAEETQSADGAQSINTSAVEPFAAARRIASHRLVYSEPAGTKANLMYEICSTINNGNYLLPLRQLLPRLPSSSIWN